jgi:deoxycytidylate deaminase
MVHAHVASLRSGALGRQVGAVISTPEGQIMAAGTNEVPKYGGGQYWSGDDPDNRDITREHDSSDLLKQMNVGEILDRLADQKDWLTDLKRTTSSQDRAKEALPILKGTRIMQPLEYGRAVHAEMAAIVDAAFRGVSIRGCVLYNYDVPLS